MDQFRVIKHVTLSLGTLLEREVSQALDRPIRVAYEYCPDARKGTGSLSVIHCSLDKCQASVEREYERHQGVERFRQGSLNVHSRFLVSAWAKPPEDLDMLGAVLRTIHDKPNLEPETPDEATFLFDGEPEIEAVPLSIAEHKLLADGYGMPLAPSICYSIKYQIQSIRTTEIKRVRERVIDIRKIDG